jgi:hypothetical protein
MWFKDEAHRSDTFALDSPDLKEWRSVKDPGVYKLSGEAPKVFRFGDGCWMLKDPDSCPDVHRSADLETWTYQGKILARPRDRNDDASIGKHADVVVCGNRAFIINFTHPNGRNFPAVNGRMRLVAKRSSIQAAEPVVRDGTLTFDRDRPFKIALTAP